MITVRSEPSEVNAFTTYFASSKRGPLTGESSACAKTLNTVRIKTNGEIFKLLIL